MRITEARLKQIIKEEVEAFIPEKDEATEEEYAAAAEDIINTLLNGELTEAGEGFFTKLLNLIKGKAAKEGLEEEPLAEQIAIQSQTRREWLKGAGAIAALTAIGGPLRYFEVEAAREREEARHVRKKERAAGGQTIDWSIDELTRVIESSANFAWSLSGREASLADEEGMFRTTTRANFPMFTDKDYGIIEIVSPEFGVTVKLLHDLREQVKEGVTARSDAVPGIKLDSMGIAKEPSMSKDEYMRDYKDIYNIPEFTKEGGLQGAVDRIRKDNPGGFGLIKMADRSGHRFLYNKYEGTDTLNPTLPKSGVSASQYYMILFRRFVNQNY